METAGCGVGQAGSPTLAHASPLTTLAHVAVGETREVRGRGETFVSWHPAGPAGLPATPDKGEAGWWAWRVDRHTAEPLRPPTPVGEGGGRWQGGCQGAGGRSFPDKG